MKVFGNVIVGPSNNSLKRHHIKMHSNKRYPHERKYLPKAARIKYHTMN